MGQQIIPPSPDVDKITKQETQMAERRELIRLKIKQVEEAFALMKEVMEPGLVVTAQDWSSFKDKDLNDVQFLVDHKKYILTGLSDLASFTKTKK